MRLFFIIPWPLDDPLTLATVVPHLVALADDPRVEAIHLFAPQRLAQPAALLPQSEASGSALPARLPAKVQHHPQPALQARLPLISRWRHHRRCSRLLALAAVRHKPALTICRGAAAVHGERLRRRHGIPFVAESFEPHAEYMRQTGTWSRWDLKYLVQRHWENRVKHAAAALITVSHGYARHLREREAITPSRLHTVPCWVDASRFRLDPEARLKLRRQLGIGDRLAVVYAGKFGGIYSPLQDLVLLRQLQQELGRPLFVIILTSADADAVRRQLAQAGFRQEQLYVFCVPHAQVPDYLNAADLAVSFINSGPWSFACSAIKHGEYWACGLPVLMPPGVGDEASWLEVERAGAIARFSDPAQVRRGAQRLLAILAEPGHRQRIRALALRERSPEPLRRVYRRLLEAYEPTGGSPA